MIMGDDGLWLWMLADDGSWWDDDDDGCWW